MTLHEQKIVYAIASATGGAVSKKKFLDEVKRLNTTADLPPTHFYLPFKGHKNLDFIFIETPLADISGMMNYKKFKDGPLYLTGFSYQEEYPGHEEDRIVFFIKSTLFVGKLSTDGVDLSHPTIVLPYNERGDYQFFFLKDYFKDLELDIHLPNWD